MFNTLQNFWAKVDKRGPIQDHMDSRCWVWTGCLDKGGYGKFTTGGRTYRAHRFSFLLATGDEPEVVAHKCNNPNCVRPSHLDAEIPLQTCSISSSANTLTERRD